MPYLIVGLGNPGNEYADTRHNFGFLITDGLIAETSAVPVKTKLLAKLWTAKIDGRTDVIMQPQTFMNESGQAVGPYLKTKEIPSVRLIVVHDDLDLPFGEIRVSKNASAAGHRGVQSIIDALKTKDFTRVRVGISRAENVPPEDYVLARFRPEEERRLPEIIDRAVEKIKTIISNRSDG